MIRWAAIVLCILFSVPASAQSRAELNQMVQDAAKKYGLPENVLTDVIQGESSFNPNIGCNSSNACGIAQFIPGTAKEYGVDVNDANSSIFGAAHYLSDLRNSTGSLGTALTRYSGGCTAAKPCNSSYATAFADAQNFDNGITGGDAVTVGDGSSLTIAAETTTAPAIPSAASVLARPFQWAWDHIMLQAQDNTSKVITQVQEVAFKPLLAIAALAGIFWGVRLWAGRLDIGDGLIALITLIIVMALVVPGNPWYSRWVDFCEGLPAYFAANIGGMDAAGPAGAFDSVWLAFWIKMVNVWHNSPWEKIILVALLLFFTIADIAVALATMFLAYLMANFVLYILLAAGAVFILGLLFPGTHGFFRFWLDLVVAVLAYIMVLNIMLSFFTTVMNQLVDSVGAGTTPWTDMIPNLLGAVIVFNIMAGVNGFLFFQFGKMHGASSAGLSRGWSAAGLTAGARAARAI